MGADGAGHTVAEGAGGCWHVCLCVWLGAVLFGHLLFPQKEIAPKQMQNSVMLKWFPNIINPVGTNSCLQNKCCSGINCCNEGRLEWQETSGGFQHEAPSSVSILSLLCNLIRLLRFLQISSKSTWSCMTSLVVLSVLFTSGSSLQPSGMPGCNACSDLCWS